ncbi:DNA polymerase alpha catalytic [Cyclospora cayetanensis]|uniref:DNA polymerase n=1 Tax=Cyclospora cayetanensis TaxID=88456 RepID=A0A1D3CSK1_9EIME|nr:DNA polymerase alpha catalytic [Cyclospora cayetanensis]
MDMVLVASYDFHDRGCHGFMCPRAGIICRQEAGHVEQNMIVIIRILMVKLSVCGSFATGVIPSLWKGWAERLGCPEGGSGLHEKRGAQKGLLKEFGAAAAAFSFSAFCCSYKHSPLSRCCEKSSPLPPDQHHHAAISTTLVGDPVGGSKGVASVPQKLQSAAHAFLFPFLLSAGSTSDSSSSRRVGLGGLERRLPTYGHLTRKEEHRHKWEGQRLRAFPQLAPPLFLEMSTASKGGALSALEKIRKQRRGEAKATEQYEVRDENAEIFATVSAQEYAELKQSRRAGNWIEGDDGKRAPWDSLPQCLLCVGSVAEGYSDDGEEWWQSDSGSEDGGRANAPRTAKRRGTEERDAKGALPTPVGKKKKGLSAAAEMRAKGMRSLLQHFSSMASEKAGTLGASEDAEAGSSAPPRLSGAAAERSDAEEEAEEATVRCDIFESSSEHFGARRKMVAVDLFAAGSEEAAQPQQSEPEGASRGPLVLDEAVGASEGLPVCPDGSLPFYFLDAWDDVASGTVYLFGKVWGVAAGGQQQQGSAAAVAPPQSCCVVVKRMMRPLFFFLRKQVTLDAGIEGLGADGATPEAGEAAREALLASFLREKQENAKEFLRMDGQRLKQRYHWSTWKCKATTRHYAFDAAGVPRSRNLQVVKVLCPGSAPSLEAEDLQGVTYSRVFGSNAPLTEVLLVKRRIKGPCWLKITDFCLPESPADKASWCRHEVIVEGHKQIRVWGDSRKAGGEEEASSPQPVDGKEPPAPPLTLLSLVAKSVSVSNNPSEDRALCMAAFFIQRHKDIEEQQAQPVLTKENIFCGVRRIRSGGGGKAQTGALGAPVCARAMSSGVPPLFEEKAEKSAVQVYDSERVLLTNLINRVYAQDPDVILGHNIYGADLELIARRCNFHGLPLWHKMSRLKRPKTQKPPCSNPRQQHQHQSCLWGGRVLSVGRLVCDTYLQARELLGHKTNYNLLPLLREAFPMPAAGVAASGGTGAGSKISAFHRRIATELQRMQPFPCEDLLSFYWSQDPSRLLYAANLCCLEAFMASILAQRLNCLPVTRELTTIGGNLWVRSLQNARAERNAFLLMHAFHAEKFVYPDPPGPRGKAKSHEAAAPAEMEDPSDGEGAEAPSAAPGGASRSSKGPAYAGGLVLEPRAGLYDSFVLLLDFNSLYPSIIQEYNVCFSTVRRAQASENGEAAGDEDASVWEIDSTPGLLPRVLQQLVQKRRQVKAAAQKERDPAKKASLDVKQLALKLTANSIYGCLGFSGSRFYAKPLAAYITQQGRTVLMAAKEKVEQQLRLSVLYGDTDSLMVDTGLRDEGRGEAYAESVRLGQRIKSEINRQYKKLELDLEAVFRRLLLLRKKKAPAPAGDEDAVDTVVALLHERLRAMREAIVGGQVPLDLFVITRALTKSPQLYAQGSGGAAQPHVLVALRMLAAGRPNLGLKPDVEYYLQHQLFPPVQRLCAHVQGTGPGRLAECLGLNPAKFGERELGEEAGDDQTGESERQKGEDRILSLIKKSDEVFKECNIPAQIPCGLCGVWLPAAQGLMTSRCGACGGWLSPSALRDTLRLYLAYIRHSFHIHITRCTECKHKFEYLPPGPLRAGASLRCPLCDGGRIVDCVSPNVLYMQLQHLRFLLSQNTGSKGSSTSASPAGMRLALDECHAAVPLPSSPQLGEPARPLNLSESLPKAGLTRAKEAAVGVKKGLELKFPLVVAALRYLRGLKSGVLCVSSESERHSLMEPVTTTMTANALNTLDLRSFFCALRTPTGAEGQSSRWALLAQTYIDAKAAAVESALPLDAGVRDPWGAPAGMQRRRSGGLPLGFKGFGSPTVTIKREVY